MTKFGTSDPYTLGVEEEFQILDPETGDLVSRADEVLGKAGASYEENFHSELFQAIVETATDVCADIDEVREEVTRLRGGLTEVLEDKGYKMAAAGTHPFAKWENQDHTDSERYQELLDEVRWPARRELIFGLHMHVAVEGRSEAIFVTNHLRPFLPILLALSTNAPFWRGEDTGLKSIRVRIFDAMPRSGLPRTFEGWGDFQGTMKRLKQGGSITDVTKIWWDVRPRPDLGTVEVRIADLPTEMEHTLALTALVQSLVVRLSRACQQGDKPPVVHEREVIEENRWRALRDGLDANFIQYANVSDVVQLPAQEAISRTLEHLGSVPDELGVRSELKTLEQIAHEGVSGADRQLQVYGETGDLKEVVRDLVARTRV